MRSTASYAPATHFTPSNVHWTVGFLSKTKPHLSVRIDRLLQSRLLQASNHSRRPCPEAFRDQSAQPTAVSGLAPVRKPDIFILDGAHSGQTQ